MFLYLNFTGVMWYVPGVGLWRGCVLLSVTWRPWEERYNLNLLFNILSKIMLPNISNYFVFTMRQIINHEGSIWLYYLTYLVAYYIYFLEFTSIFRIYKYLASNHVPISFSLNCLFSFAVAFNILSRNFLHPFFSFFTLLSDRAHC